MKLTPSSTARRSVALAFSRSGGSPQMPWPVIRIAPNPSRLTVMSPPTSMVPASAALGVPFMPYLPSLLLQASQASRGTRRRDSPMRPRPDLRGAVVAPDAPGAGAPGGAPPRRTADRPALPGAGLVLLLQLVTQPVQQPEQLAAQRPVRQPGRRPGTQQAGQLVLDLGRPGQALLELAF